MPNTDVRRPVRRCVLANGAATITSGDVTLSRSKVRRQSCQQYETGYLCLRQVEGFPKDPQTLKVGRTLPDSHRETVAWL